MYFHTDDQHIIDVLAGVLLNASDTGRRIRLNVTDDGSLTYKLGEGIWSAPYASTEDPYRDQSQTVKGMKWFINECGDVYDYPAEYQRRVFPNDDHVPYATEEEAEYAAAHFKDLYTS